jgi:hypothetical protein
VTDRLAKQMEQVNKIQVNDVAVGAAILRCLGLCFDDRVVEVAGLKKNDALFKQRLGCAVLDAMVFYEVRGA